MPGPPPGAIPGPVPVGDPHLPAGTIDGHADVWGPTCWIGAEYLLWWVKHGPNRTPLATVAPGNTFGLLTDPNSHVVLGGDTFKYNNFSGVRILGSLAHELRRRGGGYGVAALCIGVGQGLAVVLHA